MNNKSEITMNYTSGFFDVISWLYGIAVLAVGLINTFWGNDPEFGVFLVFLSFVYFLPVNAILTKMTGLSIPKMRIAKILLGSLGVGELFDKIDLMMMDL